MIRWISILVLILSAGSVYADPPSDIVVEMIGAWETRGQIDPDRAIGDRHLKNKAYGWLQIRQLAVTDVRRKLGNEKLLASDCLGNRELSIRICRAYIDVYATEKRIGRKPTDEDKIRIWNGGPDGWKKESTVGYYRDLVNHWNSLKKKS